MKHIRPFVTFVNEEELSTEELESQTVPTHIVIKDVVFDGHQYLSKYDTVFVDFEGERLFCMEDQMILDFGDGQMDGYLLDLNTPEGKKFVEDHKGAINMKSFGI